MLGLLENNSVALYIEQNQPDVFSEFVSTVGAVSLVK
jgi:hypothetical protein